MAEKKKQGEAEEYVKALRRIFRPEKPESQKRKT